MSYSHLQVIEHILQQFGMQCLAGISRTLKTKMEVLANWHIWTRNFRGLNMMQKKMQKRNHPLPEKFYHSH